MARIEFAPRVFKDFSRFLTHMETFQVEDPLARIDEIIEALDILARNPFIGRRERGDKREWVIGHGSRGYVALYRFDAGSDTVYVLTIRSQSEAGYKRPG